MLNSRLPSYGRLTYFFSKMGSRIDNVPLRPRFKCGQFVDIFLGNKWQAGLINRVLVRGAFEYGINLLSDGREVFEHARNMRASSINFDEDDDMNIFGPVQPSAAPPKGRFATVDEQDLVNFELGAKADNTHRQTKWGVRIFRGKFFRKICNICTNDNDYDNKMFS